MALANRCARNCDCVILLSARTVGFYKWIDFDAFDLSNQELDGSKGLRFSLVRSNGDKPIYFSLYSIKKELKLPSREVRDEIKTWFSSDCTFEFGITKGCKISVPRVFPSITI